MITAAQPPRYLVSFHPKSITHRFTDILILGSGLGGLRAALEVDPSLSVLVLTKEKAQHSNSNWAQGGIAAVWDPSDCFASHAHDTIDAGKGLCDEKVVDLVVQEAPVRVKELMEWGAHFDERDGAVQLGREGGHSFNRILHALGDATGQEVMRAVIARVRSRPNIRIMEDTFTIDLLTDGGRCVGALTWSKSADIQAVWAKETILATGGCGQLFRETTNPPVATGDGMAMAYRAGAELRDMEFLQFHPTVLYVAGSSRSLISEAVRGEGAYLRDVLGNRFMLEFDPRGELAPRDIVARSIAIAMAKTQHPCVYLDQSHLDQATVRKRFPGITAACAKCGLDFALDRIPVRPGAHYMVGGISTDLNGQSTLPGLWACGEVGATGLHGANRLASNSLLEALVFGHLSGEGASNAAKAAGEHFHAAVIDHQVATPAPVEADSDEMEPEELDLADIRNSLSALMWREVGIDRNQAGLESACKQVDFWSKYVLTRELGEPAGWELQNMLTVAGLMIRSALERTESRGTHQRRDYPDTNDAKWKHPILCVREAVPV